MPGAADSHKPSATLIYKMASRKCSISLWVFAKNTSTWFPKVWGRPWVSLTNSTHRQILTEKQDLKEWGKIKVPSTRELHLQGGSAAFCAKGGLRKRARCSPTKQSTWPTPVPGSRCPSSDANQYGRLSNLCLSYTTQGQLPIRAPPRAQRITMPPRPATLTGPCTPKCVTEASFPMLC